MWLEITTLLIPGENDSDGEIDAMTAWIADRLGPGVPLHFTAFHPDWKMLDRPPHSGLDPHQGPCPRPGQRLALRLHGQRARPERRHHRMPWLRPVADRAGTGT